MGLTVSPPTGVPANITVTTLTVPAITSPPLAVAYAANVPLDVAANNHFAIGLLTGNITIAFSNAANGRSGIVWVRQDATGARTVAFTTPGGFTLVRDEAISDLTPASAANKLTRYAYLMYALSGTNFIEITKAKMG